MVERLTPRNTGAVPIWQKLLGAAVGVGIVVGALLVLSLLQAVSPG